MTGFGSRVAAAALVLAGCAPSSSPLVFAESSESDPPLTIAEAAGLDLGVVVVAHALNCELGGRVLMRLKEIHAQTDVFPVKLVLIAPDAEAVKQAASHMDLTMPYKGMDGDAYASLATSLGVSAPFFAVLRNGRPIAVFANMAPESALESLEGLLRTMGIPIDA